MRPVRQREAPGKPQFAAIDPNKRALVVSDDATMREALAACLSGAGCRVDAVAFGADAQSCYRSSAYRLVVVDLPDQEPDAGDFEELLCMLSAAPCEAEDDPLPERLPFTFHAWPQINPNIGHRPAIILLSSAAGKKTHGQAYLHEQLVGALAKPVRRDYLLDLARELMDLGRSLKAERDGCEL